MSRMRRRNIDRLIIIIYAVDLLTFNEFFSSTFNDDSNLFEKNKHVHVQTSSLTSSFIFLLSISLVSSSLSRFKYDDYDSNVNMIEKTKHDTRISAKGFSHSQKHEFQAFDDDDRNDDMMNDEVFRRDDKVFRKNDEIFRKDDEVFRRNNHAKMISDVEDADVNKENYISDILIIESDTENLSSRSRSSTRFNVQQELKDEIDELRLFMIYSRLIQFVS